MSFRGTRNLSFLQAQRCINPRNDKLKSTGAGTSVPLGTNSAKSLDKRIHHKARLRIILGYLRNTQYAIRNTQYAIRLGIRDLCGQVFTTDLGVLYCRGYFFHLAIKRTRVAQANLRYSLIRATNYWLSFNCPALRWQMWL